jgi:DNA-binding transcriptional MocR family regulator
MPTQSRLQIARDAEMHGVPIMEDECLAEMVFHGRRAPSIAMYSSTAPILTLGSMSKLVCPALRVGWIRGPLPIITRLAKLKSAMDLGSSLMTQAIGAEIFEDLDEVRVKRSQEMRAKHEFLTNVIRSHDTDWEFEEPQGGMSLWLRMPGVDARLFSQVAQRHSVLVATGDLFSIDESHPEYLRIPFLLETQQLEQGVEGLVEAWKRFKDGPTSVTRQMESAVV